MILKDVDGVGMMYLDDNDVVRHRLVKKVIAAYKDIENRN
ncbi:phosphate starvation-inducible protein phoH [Nonlabens ulvanivorans]|uniref:Phosphate starvation-inducible protein phoH n=1 Tax=Nonlabens ulvanivorans TaxID=906888 RepID=A0A081DFQ4_NONUL|nr:phosphate starvation-inducible protein phoH [Nonlabens ulvanivorans]